MITKEEADRVFRYDEETGNIFWKEKPSPKANRIKPGDEAGSIVKSHSGIRYKSVSLYNKSHLVHRVIWLMHNGSLPDGVIDHIDGDGINNKIENLRCVTQQENLLNRTQRTDNTSGSVGVSKHKCGKWIAQLQINKKKVYLGLFDSIDKAVEARKKASIEYGFHKNHGKEKIQRRFELVSVEVKVPFGDVARLKAFAKSLSEKRSV